MKMNNSGGTTIDGYNMRYRFQIRDKA